MVKTNDTKTPARAAHQQNRQSFFSRESANSFFSTTSENEVPEPFFVQTKLTIGQPHDKYEQEADDMADKVVQRLSENKTDVLKDNKNTIQTKPLAPLNSIITPFDGLQAKCAKCEQEEKLQKKEEVEERDLLKDKLQKKPIFESNAELPDDESNIQRKCAECEKEEKKDLQTKSENNSPQMAKPSLESTLSSSKGNGTPLPENIRTQMEPSFGADFSSVRIHNDSFAVQMNKDLHAQAFTHGSDIYFNSDKYDPNSNNGKHLLSHELTHVVQQNGLINNKIQTRLFDDRTERQKIDDALNSKDPSDVKDIEDVNRATEEEKIKLIRILAYQGWVGPNDEYMIEKIWGSFGEKVIKMASENIVLWKKCVDGGAELEKLKQIKDLKNTFASDVRAIAKEYLNLNKSYAQEELQSLGLANPEKTTEEDKAESIAELKQAAELVKKAQEGQDRLKGMRIVGSNLETYCDEVCISQELPAYFSPEKPPQFQQRGKDEKDLPTWDQTKKQYDRFTSAIIGLSNRYPSIYALVRDEKIKDFAQADSAKAVTIVSDSLNNVLKYIEVTVDKIDSGAISYFDLVPIHQQLFEGTKTGPSQTKWNEEVFKWVAESDISAHESKEFWITIGLTTLAAAAFVVAELATAGTATFAIAAGIGVGIGAGQAAHSWEHYKNLADASKSNVSDETALVSQGQASAALVEAVINTAFVFVDLYAPLAKGVRAAAKLGEEAAEVGTKAASKEALESAEKDLAEKAAKEAAEKKAAEQLTKEIGETGGKSLSRTVLDFVKDIIKEFTESVKKWATFVFDKLGFKRFWIEDEGEYLVLYGERSVHRLARFRKDSLEKFIIQQDQELSEKLSTRGTKLAKSKLAREQGKTALENTLRKGAIDLSEEIGEDVAKKVAEQKFPGAVLLHIGEGSGTLDLVYKLPSGEFLVIEAKGGAGKLGFREIAEGVKAQQGTKSYLRDVAKNMIDRGAKAGATDEAKAEAKVGNELLKALNNNKVKYALTKAPIPKDFESIVDVAFKEFLIQ